MQLDYPTTNITRDQIRPTIPPEAPAGPMPHETPAGPTPTEAAAQERGKPVTELTPQELGARGEEVAARHLVSREWEVLERNWRCMHGEVDIVARDPEREDAVVLVEVKTRLARGERDDVIPELAVGASKRRRYRMCALTYLFSHQDVTSVCFDVIAINVAPEGGAHLRHLFNAYSLDS